MRPLDLSVQLRRSLVDVHVPDALVLTNICVFMFLHKYEEVYGAQAAFVASAQWGAIKRQYEHRVK